MSRIGYKPIQVPAGVEVTVENNLVTVKGPHGELERQFSDLVIITREENELKVDRADDSPQAKKQHGTARSLLFNMVSGVHERFKIQLDIIGVGYRAQLQGNTLVMSVGYSQNVEFEIPQGIEVTLPRNTTVIIEGHEKQVVGEFAANVRGCRPPEPYKGKGVRYADEEVRRKEGKTVQ